MKERALILSLASIAAAGLLLECIGDPPIPPLAVGPSDASVDGTTGHDASGPGVDASGTHDGAADAATADAADAADANLCGAVTACIGGDGCCPSGCTSKTDSDCAVAVCGDGIVEPGETCDDGNTKNGDGCDPTCLFANTLEHVSGFPGGPGYADSDAGADVRFSKQGGLATDATWLYYADPAGTIRRLDPATGASITIAGANAQTASDVDEAGTNARFTSATALSYIDATSVNGEKMLFVHDGANLRAINVRDPSFPVSTVSLFSVGQSVVAGTNQAGPRIFNLDNSAVEVFDITSNGYMSDAELAPQIEVNDAVYGGPQSSWGPANCQEIAYAGYDSATMTATFYLGCPDTIVRIVQAPGGTSVTLFAGVPKTAGCADNANALAATLTNPVGLSVDASGTLYFTDCNKIRRVDVNGVSTYAGNGTVGWVDATASQAAEFTLLGSTAVVGSTLYAVDGPRIRSVTSTTATSTLASGSGSRGTTLDPTGAAASYGGGSILGLATDASGSIYVLQSAQVIKVNPTTGGSSLAFTIPALGDAGTSAAVSMTTMNQKLYIAFANGTVWASGFDGSGFTQFGTAAVNELASDGTNLYYISTGRTIGEISAAGVTSLVCGSGHPSVKDGSGANASFGQPIGIAYVGNSILYVADEYDGYGDLLLRKVDVSAGSVTTVAGNDSNVTQPQADGVGPAANFAALNHLASDGVSLFAIDSGFGYGIQLVDGATIRQMNPTTLAVTTMIGTQGQYAAAPGVGTAAHLNRPAAFTFDPASKHLILADESAIFHVR